jgi:saccharopine dehydrogenase (NAD+, L-lysine-forming)
LAREHKVVVIGAGGSQAQAMLRALVRGGVVDSTVAVDRAWRTGAREATEAMGFSVQTMDPLSDPLRLRALLASTDLVVNMAGPYYKTGTLVLDAAIETGTDYLDISDDADVSIPMLERSQAAERAGIRALIGMGSSPGTTNVLIRAAVDKLGPVDDVDISWTVDVSDLTEAAIRHFWHCFNLVDQDGNVSPVAGWDELDFRDVEFPEPVGRQRVVRLAHPEPITVPRFLPVKNSSNFGGLNPLEALVVAWSLANIADEQRSDGEFTDSAASLFRHYRERRVGAPRIGSGLIIDVHTNGNGLRFASGSEGGMDDSTGIPAAVGVVLMVEGRVNCTGVLAPEVLEPKDFFEVLRRVSAGGGGLTLHRLEAGKPKERLRIRDLIS